MNNPLSVTIVSSPGPSALGGPVPAVVTLRNTSGESVSVLLPYPNPNNLSFACADAGFAEPREVRQDAVERVAPIQLEPGASDTFTYFLNRYFSFRRAGRAEIAYSLHTVVDNQDVLFTGKFPIEVAEVATETLKAALSREAAKLAAGTREGKLEAAEALIFLDTPLVVRYLIYMLGVDNLEVPAVHALGNHRSEESDLAIALMLPHPDSAVVGAALEEIDRIQIPVPRLAIQRLLSASNPSTQWLALGWLAKRPSREDLPLLVKPANSMNEAVKKRALEYRRALTGN